MDTSNLKTLSQLKQLYGEEKWRFMALHTIDGDILVAYNNQRTTPENKWKEILKKFSSNLLPEGVYLFKAKNAPNTRTVEEKIFVVKGDMAKAKKQFETRELSEPAVLPAVQKKPADIVQSTPAVLTWAEAIGYMQRISDLQRDKELLEAKVKALEEEIEDLKQLQDDDDDEPGIPSWLQDIMPTLDKGLERYFNIQDKQLAQREAIMRYKGIPVNGNSYSTRVRTAMNDDTDEMQEAKAKYLRYMDKLIEAGKDEQFDAEMEKLKTVNPELHKQIYDACKAAGYYMNRNSNAGRQ